MQNALRTKLAELQNSRRIKEEEEKAEEKPKKLDFSLLDDSLSEFANRSWVEIIDEEERRLNSAPTSANCSLSAVDECPSFSPTASTSNTTTTTKRPNKRTATEEEEQGEQQQHKQRENGPDGGPLPKKFDFSIFDKEFGNRSWVEIIDEEEQRQQQNATKAMAASVTVSVVQSSAPGAKRRRILPTPKEGWSEPRTGWCMDSIMLERREKDLQKMKEKPTYKRYLSQIPKFARKKNVHPRTPNKYINHTRRSWDKQVRLWKLAIYEWAGETPTSSVCGSRCPSECSESGEDSPKPAQKKARTMSNGSCDIGTETADQMASIIGHFDLNTMRGVGDETTTATLVAGGGSVGGRVGWTEGDESTMKPMTMTTLTAVGAAVAVKSKTVRGPTDFSDLVVPKKEGGPSAAGDEGWMEVKKRPKLEAKKKGRTTTNNNNNQ